MTRKWLALLTGSLLLTGCAAAGPPRAAGPEDGAVLACRTFFRAADKAIEDHGTADREAARISGFPYLRVNRFLASFRNRIRGNGHLFDAWVDRLAALGEAGRRYELVNLPDAVAAGLPLPGGVPDAIQASRHCGVRLRRFDLAAPEARERLIETATVPDEYRTFWRVLGFYPITSLFVSAGVSRWHDEAHATFDKPLTELSVAGRLIRFAPPPAPSLSPDQTARIIAASAENPLGIPEPAAIDSRRLFTTFAPTLEVDVATGDDLIGVPRWSEMGPDVDTTRPTLYTRLSHTRWNGKVLLQLNYVFWFPARPKTGAFDLYGGRLDGITWRVTLDSDGVPLLYDAVHNCGCYHMFFPTSRLRLRRDVPGGYFEPPLVPQTVSGTPGRKRLRIAHHTHYIERVLPGSDNEDPIPYGYRAYEALRSLPYAGGQRSLFGPREGIVPGTERLESLILWPMGIPAPGAMRQWGNHATAFVGRRHFDEPYLIGRLFEPAPLSEGGVPK